MAFIVEVFRANSQKPNTVDFNIHFKIWEQLLDEGRKAGWKPLGTVKPDKLDYPSFKNDYNPDYPDSKIVSAEDAQNWARALSASIETIDLNSAVGPAIIRDEISKEPTIVAAGLDIDFVKNFIDYLKLGEFQFWWDN